MSNTSLEIIKNRPRNLIINGGFDHWQRGTYFTGHGYGPDRWNYNYSLAGFAHGSGKDSTDQPNGQFCHALNVATPASPGPADWCALSHRIEGRDLVGLIGKKFVFSADFKTTVAGTYYISFANHNITRRLYKPITLQANVWERKHVVIEFDTQLSSWNFDNTVGMYVEIMLATGSNYIGTGDGTNWADGNLGKADQVNFTNNAAAIFRTNNVMLHEGEYPLDFYPAGNTYAEELRLCQRYYYSRKYYSAYMPTESHSATNNVFGHVTFPVNMRIAPIFSWDGVGSLWRMWHGVGEYRDVSTMSINTSAIDSVMVNIAPVGVISAFSTGIVRPIDASRYFIFRCRTLIIVYI